jgi:hypothetical protein
VSGRRLEGWITASVFGLVVMATWTVVIKYVAPLVYFAAESAEGRVPVRAPVMWDFWWVAHIALAWLLWKRHRWAWMAGMTVAAAEIAIVAIKFVLYFDAPDFSFWRLLWFTNKLYVLAFFLYLIALLSRPAVRDRLGSAYEPVT